LAKHKKETRLSGETGNLLKPSAQYE
jgi:hypothetical protein